jgi:hypothetical protein
MYLNVGRGRHRDATLSSRHRGTGVLNELAARLVSQDGHRTGRQRVGNERGSMPGGARQRNVEIPCLHQPGIGCDSANLNCGVSADQLGKRDTRP